ncbi:protein Wnt-5-like [Anopheles nili]|uniref:protein Wnt-5-like n=1 Tax=Anopheles nili TaxID=185578 RepID=UPI00237A33C1|nr:protein Wnt-5-like [Anopheles nili]
MAFDSSRCWITLLCIGTFYMSVSSNVLGVSLGQGLPTWISLGIKSPFIVFRVEQEVLSNNSVLLNLTDIRNKLKSVHNLDHFIRPIDSNNERKIPKKDHIVSNNQGGRLANGGTVSSPAAPPVFSAESAFGGGNISITFLTTVVPSFVNHFEKSSSDGGGHEASPILPIKGKYASSSNIGSTDHMISDDDGGGGKKERKYIIPLALKTSTNEKEKTSSVFHGSSTNIDDLKRHILMLQNLTQSDKNFQSKFVVFPSLQKNGTISSSMQPVSRQTPVLLPSVTLPPRQIPVASTATDYRSFVSPNRGQNTTGEAYTTNNRSAQRTPGSIPINMPKKVFPDSHDILSDRKEGELEMYKMEKITIVPQVFLQNDQTSETVSDKRENRNIYASRAVAESGKVSPTSQIGNSEDYSRIRETKERTAVRKFVHKSMASVNDRTESQEGTGGVRDRTVNSKIGITTPRMSVITSRRKETPISAGSVEIGKQRWDMNGPLLNGSSLLIEANATSKGKKKQRKNGRRRGGKQTVKFNDAKEVPKTVILNDDASILDEIGERTSSDVGRIELSEKPKPGRIAGSRKRASSSRVRRNDNNRRQQLLSKQQYYATIGRVHQTSKTERHDSQAMMGSMESLVSTIDTFTDEDSVDIYNRSQHNRNRTSPGDGNEKDIVDLNPNLCYTLSALSGGQQKLCAQHTSIMPAISRGARAAIQECKHQFRNRRWNCSIVNDESVFGPVSNIGSPEMAFVYAMAAAAASSFIARACRDGQLASCGCSRSSRPSKLNEDWTWGGCGDDMEYGYK